MIIQLLDELSRPTPYWVFLNTIYIPVSRFPERAAAEQEARRLVPW